MNLKKLNREQLNALAVENGIENPEEMDTNADVVAKLQEVMPSESASPSEAPAAEVEEVEDDGLVEIMVPAGDGGATAPEVVNINGVTTEIPLGVPTRVPANVAALLKDNYGFNLETNKETN